MAEQRITIEVAYAKPLEQVIIELTVKYGTTLGEAVAQSGILLRYPEIELATGKFGIFGKAAGLDRVLEDGERVEIYRPLIADPKEARKKRAVDGKAMRKGGGSAERT